MPGYGDNASADCGGGGEKDTRQFRDSGHQSGARNCLKKLKVNENSRT
jgi:hypothetical protein